LFLILKAFDGAYRDLLDLEIESLSKQCARLDSQRIGEEEVAGDDIVKDDAFYKKEMQKVM